METKKYEAKVYQTRYDASYLKQSVKRHHRSNRKGEIRVRFLETRGAICSTLKNSEIDAERI